MKTVWMRKTAAAAIVMILMFTIVACNSGNSGNSNTPDPAPAQTGNSQGNTNQDPAPANDPEPADEAREPVTLRVLWWANTYDPLLEEFTAQYPWITVEPVTAKYGADAGVGQQLAEEIAAGNPIDLFWHNSLDMVVQDDIAEDLTPYIEQDEEFKQFEFVPDFQEQFQVDGKQVGLARGIDALYIFVNKDLLEQYGMEMPSNDWTYEQLREMAKKATNPDNKTWGLSNHPFWWTNMMLVYPLANGNAETVGYMTPDFTRNLADGSNNEVLDDLNFIAEMNLTDGSVLTAKKAQDAGIQGDGWASGNVLFHYMVAPFIQEYKNTLTFDWDILPLPRGKAGQPSFSWITAWYMSKASKHKEEAWLFLKFWVTNKEFQKKLYDVGATIPTTHDPELQEHFKQLNVYEGLNTGALQVAMDNAVFDPTQTMVAGADFQKAYFPYFGQGANQGLTAYDYFPPAMQRFNEILAERLAQ